MPRGRMQPPSLSGGVLVGSRRGPLPGAVEARKAFPTRQREPAWATLGLGLRFLLPLARLIESPTWVRRMAGGPHVPVLWPLLPKRRRKAGPERWEVALGFPGA